MGVGCWVLGVGYWMVAPKAKGERQMTKVKVGTRVSNFRFHSQLSSCIEELLSSRGGMSWEAGTGGQQTLSTKQTVVNFWQGKYFFPFRLFALGEAHLAPTSVDFYSILLSNANGCSCTSSTAAAALDALDKN